MPIKTIISCLNNLKTNQREQNRCVISVGALLDLSFGYMVRDMALQSFLFEVLEAIKFSRAKHFIKFWYRAFWEYLCEINSSLSKWFRRCGFKTFLFHH